jgi:hypothetical protein
LRLATPVSPTGKGSSADEPNNNRERGDAMSRKRTKTYKVNFASDAEFASEHIDADTPEQALAMARRLYEDDPSALWFEPYTGMEVNEIIVYDAKGDESAVWYDDDMRLRLAASELLEALEDLVERERAEAADSGFADDEMTWLEDARRAIAKVKDRAE